MWCGLRLSHGLHEALAWGSSLLLSELSQFPDIVDFCEKMANQGKTVIVAALDGTFQRKVKCLTPACQRVLRGKTVYIQGLREVGVFRIEAIGWWVL